MPKIPNLPSIQFDPDHVFHVVDPNTGTSHRFKLGDVPGTGAGIRDEATNKSLFLAPDGGIVVGDGESRGDQTLNVGEIYTMDNNPYAPNTVRKPGIIIFMFSYPGFSTNDSGNGPNYNEKTWWFRRLVDAIKRYPMLQFFVIVNPLSGPGVNYDGNYKQAVDWLKGAGASVLGYTSSAWSPYNPDNIPESGVQFPAADKSFSDMKSEIDRYKEWYPRIDGIWFDELPFETEGQDGINARKWYIELTRYAKREKGFYYTGGNPGQSQRDRSYFREDAIDFATIYEQETEPSQREIEGHPDFPDNNIETHPRRKGIMVHNVPGSPLSKAEIARRVNNHRRYVDLIYYWPDDTYGNGIAWDSDDYSYHIDGVARGILTERNSIDNVWAVETQSLTAENADKILADTSGGTFTISLPLDPEIGYNITVADFGNTFNSTNLTVDGNGLNIEGSPTYIFSTDGARADFVYNGSQWIVR